MMKAPSLPLPRIAVLVLSTWLALAPAGALAPLAPPGATAELVEERVVVALAGDGTTLFTLPTIATDSAAAGALLPVTALEQAAVTDAAVVSEALRMASRTETVRQVVWTTLPEALRLLRDEPRAGAVPGREVTGEAAAAAVELKRLPPDAGEVRGWVERQGFALTEPLSDWIDTQVEAERSFVALRFEAPGAAVGEQLQAVQLPALRLELADDEPFVPFSEPQLADDATAAASERPYALAILDSQRYVPVYADGYPLFPSSALELAHTVTPEMRARATAAAVLPGLGADDAYITLYRANVPRTARSSDLAVEPDSGPDVIVGGGVREVVEPLPIPVDVLAVLVLLPLVWRLLRRRPTEQR